jgi:hypothetical protein
VVIQVAKVDDDPKASADTGDDEALAKKLAEEEGDDRRNEFLYATRGPKKAFDYGTDAIDLGDFETYDEIDTNPQGGQG